MRRLSWIAFPLALVGAVRVASAAASAVAALELPHEARPQPRVKPDEKNVVTPERKAARLAEKAEVPTTAPVVQPAPTPSPWTFTPSLSLQEGYDTNVYLQDAGSLAGQESFVTSVAPKLELTYKPADASAPGLALAYAPTFNVFHSAHDEDHVTHLGTGNLSGKHGDVTYAWTNTLTLIDGDDEGLVFDGPGGAPAIGGPTVRDRRDAFAYRTGARVQFNSGPWFVRPLANLYVHDFHTDHRPTPGYANYVDRSDVNVGVDVGRQVFPQTHLVAGYRFGMQHQADLLNVPTDFSNTYHRLLAGVEGTPRKWLKVSALAGPDFRRFGDEVPDATDRDQTRAFFDASVTLLPDDRTEVTLLARQFLQPGSGGRGAYEDTTFSVLAKRKLFRASDACVGFRAYGGDCLPPAVRQEWIYTATVSAGHAFTPRLRGEAGYSYEWSESDVPNTPGASTSGASSSPG